jgi:hypothetical protein
MRHNVGFDIRFRRSLLSSDLAVMHFENAMVAALLSEISLKFGPGTERFAANTAVDRGVTLNVPRDIQVDRPAIGTL